MAMPNMKLIRDFMTKLEKPQAFEHFYTKWPPEAILFFRLMPKIIGFLYSGTSMTMANMIGVFVIKLWPVQALACGGGDGGEDGGY